MTGVLCLVFTSAAGAHQPHVVGDAARVAVVDPETSKAYYGRLPGVPARCVIVSRRPFTRNAEIIVPDIKGARRDYRLSIRGPAGQLLGPIHVELVEVVLGYSRSVGQQRESALACYRGGG